MEELIALLDRVNEVDQTTDDLLLDEIKNREALQEAAIELELDPKTYLLGSRDHLAIVFRNLLENAAKNEAKNITIRCQSVKKDLVIEVIDDGKGIPPEFLKKIFLKFVRVPETQNRHNAKGFGLGLFIVKTLIRKMKGSITVKSQVGSGTTFKIVLPHG